MGCIQCIGREQYLLGVHTYIVSNSIQGSRRGSSRAPPTTNSTSLVRSTPRPRWFLGGGATTPLPPSSSSHVSHNHLLECRLHLQTVRGPTESLPNTIRKIIRRRRILIILTSIYSYHRRFLWIAAGKTFERTIQSQKCQIM